MAVSNTKEFFDTLGDRFVPEAAEGVNAVVQYDLSGEGGGNWVAKIEEGQLVSVSEGSAEKPSVTVIMDAQNFVRMNNGELDGRKAFLTRKLKVKGSIALAQKMQKFFPQG